MEEQIQTLMNEIAELREVVTGLAERVATELSRIDDELDTLLGEPAADEGVDDGADEEE